ncbi:MAG: nicotinate-nucleotide--dimethylbenzimidazole phosphoribosyltransferase [Deltaproteobacteria bacterium]|nr:nicotinate-nucleotide--dimethylbenzimidazole phosphoribosyltransferase [Deltaproteobacteria bacterium]
MSKLEQTINSIKPVNPAFYEKAQKRLDNLTKPQGSLGRLEQFAARIVAVSENTKPVLNKKAIFTFAGDHGVADEGVSAFPKEVTPQMVLNFLRGGAGINVLARHAGVDVVVIDIGVDYEFGNTDGLVHKKIIRGTKNIRKGPAMTQEEAIKCIEVGIDLANEYAKKGYRIFGTGEMGIANTTPSSAIAAVFSKRTVEDVTGRGTGIDDGAFKNKVRVIEDAIKINKPNPKDPLDVLAKLGGAEIAGIAGLVLGAAANRIPVVIDGFISTVGALIAYELCPTVKDYMFAAHTSVERGHWIMLEKMDMKPILNLNMRLGEGTGAALGISLIEAGVKIYNEMATFGEAGVSDRNDGKEQEAVNLPPQTLSGGQKSEAGR